MDGSQNIENSVDQIKVSVIIPVYNAEKYIERTVESILEQSFENTEIILIDDMSTDFSLEKCHELSKKDDRIIVIENNNNYGSGYSKNLGLEIMTGDFLCFVDDDDVLVSRDILFDCVRNILDFDCDIACFGYCDDRPEDGKMHYVFQSSYVMTGREAVIKLLKCDGLDSNPWCKLYAGYIYKGIRFPVGMVYDDANVTYKAFMNAKKVVNTGLLGYSHTSRTHSISGSGYKDCDWDYIINVKKTVNDLTNESEDLRNSAEIMLSKASMDILIKYGRGGKMPRERYHYLKEQFDKNYALLYNKCNSVKKRMIMSLIHYDLICILRLLNAIQHVFGLKNT
jgi:glycosyltransferase involved in cell wall biosynthesis